jgi:hypothetical protein
MDEKEVSEHHILLVDCSYSIKMWMEKIIIGLKSQLKSLKKEKNEDKKSV